MIDERRIKLSRADFADLEIPAPPDKTYHPYQKAAVLFAAFNPFLNTLLADEQGIGKTIEAIAYINFMRFSSILIIAPASLLTNWRIEFQAWQSRPLSIQIIKSGKDILTDASVLIVSYSLAAARSIFDQLKRKKFDVLILDEVHYLKSPESTRTRAIFGDIRKTELRGLYRRAKYVMALSGTPAPNRPMEFYPLLRALCPEIISSKAGNPMGLETFGFKYCNGFFDSNGRPDFRGASNQKELGQLLRSSIMIRRKKDQVLKQLPPKTYRLIYLNSDPESEKIIQEMRKFSVEDIIGKGKAINYEGLAEMRQSLGILKAPKAVEYLRDKLDGGVDKILVYAYHKSVIRILGEGLGEYGVVKIDGSVPREKRGEIVSQFQGEEKIRVFLGQLKAAGEGLTLVAGAYVVIVEPSWVWDENEQIIDRAHRLGQLRPVTGDFLVYENSLDENILKSNFKKLKVKQSIMEA